MSKNVTVETPNRGRLHFLRNGSNKGLFQKSLICHYFQSWSNKGLSDENSVQNAILKLIH